MLNTDVFKDFNELNLFLRMHYQSEKLHTLVDVGANRGEFSRAFAKRGWRVIAFEPEPNNFRALTDNLKQFPNAHCISKAVSDVSGQQVTFYVSTEHSGIHSLKPFHTTHTQTITVETTRLEDTLATLGIDSVTFLKIDTEGADFLALKGFNFNAGLPDFVMVEFMDERSQNSYGYTHHDIVEYMKGTNYLTYIAEWGAIEQYGRSHQFLQCRPYPLSSPPVWGNIIFVKPSHRETFERALHRYLADLQYSKLVRSNGFRAFCKLPGIKQTVQSVKTVLQVF